MTLDWFHFCEYSFQTSTGKPGVIGIHDVMLVTDFPAAIPFGLAMQIRTAPNSTVHVVMRLYGPEGAELVKLEGDQLANDDGCALLQLSIALTVPRAGSYSLTLSAGGVALPSQSIGILTNPPRRTGSGKPH